MSYSVGITIDPVIICPYDQNHKIAKSRIQRHLVKCEKNFPPNYKQQCPYDATHRVFQHEMVDHVSSCPMKIATHCFNTGKISKLPEFESDIESIDDAEIWDEGIKATTKSDPFDEPIFESIDIKEYTTVTPVKRSVIAKRFSNKLRRPFGYSESMMLNVSSQTIDDDAESVTSDMGVGRGQNTIRAIRGQYVRGMSSVYRRGFRGRLR